MMVRLTNYKIHGVRYFHNASVFREEDHPRDESGRFGKGGGRDGSEEQKSGIEDKDIVNQFNKPIKTVHGEITPPEMAIHGKESDFFDRDKVEKWQSRYDEGKRFYEKNKGKSEKQIWEGMSQDELDIYSNLSEVSEAFFLAGIQGNDAPRFTTGWRFGKASDSGKSGNYAENRLEKGVSIMGTRETPKIEGMYELMTKNTTPYFYAGYELPDKGSDDEPLMVGLKEMPLDKKDNSCGKIRVYRARP